MPIELKVPEVGESVTEVYIGKWYKSEGEEFATDENLVELESDKATFDVPGPITGVLSKILVETGATASVGDVIALLEESTGQDKAKKGGKDKKAGSKAKSADTSAKSKSAKSSDTSRTTSPDSTSDDSSSDDSSSDDSPIMPAAQRLLAEHGLKATDIKATGPGGRLLKEDVLKHVEQAARTPAALTSGDAARQEETVPMSPIRRRIAERLVEAQQSAALLTTFNEIDMSAVKELREQYQPAFQKKYGIKLGFMSFFIKAAVDALKQFPQLNAEIRGTDIVYHNYYDIGVAIGGGKGLVVPVLRNTERMSFAEIELAISEFAVRARENKIGLQELQGGTFTLSNGGVYGSLLSTPIVNPPQSGVLGMHSIQDRPVVRDGNIVVRPMMYVALTYDHRIVDGREAVTFLTRIKDVVEAPTRMLVEV